MEIVHADSFNIKDGSYKLCADCGQVVPIEEWIYRGPEYLCKSCGKLWLWNSRGRQEAFWHFVFSHIYNDALESRITDFAAIIETAKQDVLLDISAMDRWYIEK